MKLTATDKRSPVIQTVKNIGSTTGSLNNRYPDRIIIMIPSPNTNKPKACRQVLKNSWEENANFSNSR